MNCCCNRISISPSINGRQVRHVKEPVIGFGCLEHGEENWGEGVTGRSTNGQAEEDMNQRFLAAAITLQDFPRNCQTLPQFCYSWTTF